MTSSKSILNILNEVHPNFVISCIQGDFSAQYEKHIQIDEYLKNTNGILYFCSTSNVFDGDLSRSHNELENTNATSVYGKFKIQCENELKSILKSNLCILRLPAIWGENSPRFNQLKKQLQDKEPIEIYTNLYCTNNLDIVTSKQIHYLISKKLTGIYHLTSSDVANYYDFITSIIMKLGYKNAVIKKLKLDEDKYFLALATEKNDFPNELILTNEQIINYLTT